MSLFTQILIILTVIQNFKMEAVWGFVRLNLLGDENGGQGIKPPC